MITYVSLFLGALSSIVGALLSPKRTGTDGKERYSPWAAVFIVLPLVAFGVAAWDSYKRDTEHETQVKKLDDQLKASNKSTVALEKQVELSGEKIKDLQTRVETSIKRVDVVEARITYSFTLKEAGFSQELPDLLHHLTIAELIGYDDKKGKLCLGVVNHMFDFVPLPESYARVNELIAEGLARMSQFAAPVLMISKKNAIRESLHVAAQKAIEVPLPGVTVFAEDRLPSPVASYTMKNPRSLDVIPPVYIALDEESWFIPDHTAENPVIQLTWRFRFLNNQSAGLITTEDFRNAEVEVYAARPNPNYDRSPNLMFFRSPFGEVIDVEVTAGGNSFGWEKNAKQEDEIIVDFHSSKGATEELGQLMTLKAHRKPSS